VTLEKPLWMQAAEGDPVIEYSGARDRALLRSLLHQPGILAPDVVFGALKVTQRAAGANFSVDVQPGMCAIFGGDVANQNAYMCESTAVENLPIPPPPVSGERIHHVIARVRDKLHNGLYTTYDFVLEVLEDTGLGAPLEPDSALSLASVYVAAGQTSVTNEFIADTRVSAATITAKYPLVGADTARPEVPFESELIYRTDKTCYEFADAGWNWHEIPNRDGGGSAWTAYTPSLTAVSSNPVLGSGATIAGRYMRVGRTVTVQVNIRFGTSGTGAGSGFYEISLPVLARSINPGFLAIGSAYARDNPAANFADGQAFIAPGVNNRARISIDSSVIAHNIPWAWGANDELGFTGVYEAAS
jgi:hypothetical protein